MGAGLCGRSSAIILVGSLSTLLEVLILFICTVCGLEIKAACGFPGNGLAMLFRTWSCYSAVLRSKSRWAS